MEDLINRYHSTQFRNDRDDIPKVKIPYKDHLMGVKTVLLSAVTQTGECTDAQIIEDMCNAALGHDLLEDTAATPEEITAATNPHVLELIKDLTNPVDDAHTEQYMGQLRKASEEARLVKYADLIENTTSVAYNCYTLGEKWLSEFYEPILTATTLVLAGTDFEKYPKTAEYMRKVLKLSTELLETKRALMGTL